MKKTRLRFAPSPTGFLHIGGFWMCLFDYIIARKNKGDLILRIEDTDRKREVAGAAEKLIDILNWTGVDFNEGPHKGGDYGPYKQTERIDVYQKFRDELLEKDGAYYCFCSQDRLGKLREGQENSKEAPRYDKHCRNLSKEEAAKKIAAGESYVIRQKMPLTGEISVFDELRGEIIFNCEDLEDHILIKSDGFPTYHFASIVDDHLMEISHVVRGSEWLPSFPKNILLYKAFGWEPPKFIHCPLILSKDGGKLSKRKGDVAVEDFKNKGYLPEALINFCVLLGWHPKDDNEILSLDEIVEKFEIKDMGVKGAIFDLEKLDYINGYYIRKKSLAELTNLCEPFLSSNLAIASNERKRDQNFIKLAVKMSQERLKKLSEIGELTEFLFVSQPKYEADILIWKSSTREETKKRLIEIKKCLEVTPEENWTNNSIAEAMSSHIQSVSGKNGDYLWPTRVSLSGAKASPSPFDIAEALGKKESIERLDFAIKLLD